MSAAEPTADVRLTTLAILAFGELTAVERAAADAQSAPSVRDRVDLIGVAGVALGNYEALAACTEALGGDIAVLLEDVEPSFTALRERTRPRDWYESLMKGYVFDGINRVFYRAALVNLDGTSERVATSVLDDTRQSDHLRRRLAQAISEHPELSSRLALWGRRLVGEALVRGRQLIERFDLAVDDEAVGAISQRVMTNHSRRMAALDLVA